MKDLEGLLQGIIRDLGAQDAPYAIVGGIAVSVRTEPRFTRDIDLAVAVADDREAEALVAGLSGRGWKVTATLEQEAIGRLAAVRLQPTGEGPGGRIVDLLFASSGIEPEIVAAADDLEVLPGVRARVARTGHLIVLKALARADDRPQDTVDLKALLARADGDDFELAREAARRVVERGYHRGRDLAREVEELVSRA